VHALSVVLLCWFVTYTTTGGLHSPAARTAVQQQLQQLHSKRIQQTVQHCQLVPGLAAFADSAHPMTAAAAAAAHPMAAAV
jgi:hypothetical protein